MLAIGSVVLMALAVNWLAAGLLALTIVFYVFVYTIWLKRRTPQNIVIGGAAGAFPPMIGWAAVTGDIDLAPVVLFLLIFMWTPPHFWADVLSGQTARRDDAGARTRPRRAPGAGGSKRSADGADAADAGRDGIRVRRDADLHAAAGGAPSLKQRRAMLASKVEDMMNTVVRRIAFIPSSALCTPSGATAN